MEDCAKLLRMEATNAYVRKDGKVKIVPMLLITLVVHRLLSLNVLSKTILSSKQLMRLRPLTCASFIVLYGCSSFAESKCSFNDDIIIETVDEVTSIDMCQFYCSIIYSDVCEYFVFDRKLETCDVMKTSEMETCVKNSGGNKPNATSCGRVFIDGIYEHECLNFREGLCTYEGDRLEALDNIPSMEVCQMACQHYSLDPATTCRFFVYDSETKNCELLNSGERDCDIVRGTPQPDFEQCKKDGLINWPDRC